MKTILLALTFLAALPLAAKAQSTKKQQQPTTYVTFIYTSTSLPTEIQKEIEGGDDRAFGADMLSASLNAGKGIASGYVTSLVDLGVNAVASLVTKRKRQQEEWEQTVQSENSWSQQINSVSELKDFYQAPSKSGALDPTGMTFNGIGCISTEGEDTIFFISCHIDRSKLYRIVNHSKFELVLDTLIVCPARSNLPNTSLPIEFSFEDRKEFNLSMTVSITSSWFTYATELHQNEELGNFSINVNITKEMLDTKGYFRYVHEAGKDPKYAVTGESFIIPRSYMGYRDKDNTFHDIWGTGQYKIAVELGETCSISDSYRANWRSDRKLRKEMQGGQNGKFFANIWKTVTSQKWDELGQQWIITTLSAPADVAAQELIDGLGLTSAYTTTSASSASAAASGGMPGEH